MFLSCCKFRILSVSYCLQCSLYRNCVLLSVFDTFNSADCVRMSLAYTFAPECVIISIRKNRIRIQSVQGEHSRIPAHGDDSYMSAFFCGCIYICKMLRDSCMCIKTIDYIEHLCVNRCLFWKVCCASSANYHNVNLIFPVFYVCYITNCRSLCQNLDIFRISSCKHCHKLHIIILLYCALNASSKITIT